MSNSSFDKWLVVVLSIVAPAASGFIAGMVCYLASRQADISIQISLAVAGGLVLPFVTIGAAVSYFRRELELQSQYIPAEVRRVVDMYGDSQRYDSSPDGDEETDFIDPNLDDKL